MEYLGYRRIVLDRTDMGEALAFLYAGHDEPDQYIPRRRRVVATAPTGQVSTKRSIIPVFDKNEANATNPPKGVSVLPLRSTWMRQPGVWQVLLQPGTDAAFDVLLAKARGQDWSQEDWLREIVSLGVSAGFGVRDAVSGKTFRLQQAQQRGELGAAARSTITAARRYGRVRRSRRSSKRTHTHAAGHALSAAPLSGLGLVRL